MKRNLADPHAWPGYKLMMAGGASCMGVLTCSWPLGDVRWCSLHCNKRAYISCQFSMWRIFLLNGFPRFCKHDGLFYFWEISWPNPSPINNLFGGLEECPKLQSTHGPKTLTRPRILVLLNYMGFTRLTGRSFKRRIRSLETLQIPIPHPHPLHPHLLRAQAVVVSGMRHGAADQLVVLRQAIGQAGEGGDVQLGAGLEPRLKTSQKNRCSMFNVKRSGFFNWGVETPPFLFLERELVEKRGRTFKEGGRLKQRTICPPRSCQDRRNSFLQSGISFASENRIHPENEKCWWENDDGPSNLGVYTAFSDKKMTDLFGSSLTSSFSTNIGNPTCVLAANWAWPWK